MERWISLFSENQVLRVLFFVGIGVLLVALILGFILNSIGACTGLSVITVGGVGLCSTFYPTEKQGVSTVWLLFCMLGIIHLLLLGALFCKERSRERKRQRARVERQLRYTLPDRENSYVRTRLNTALHVKEEPEEETEPTPVRLEYAQELLCRVKNAPLTAAERLQTEEMETQFALFVKKADWTANDVRCTNELCAALLKLSAKYSV